MVAIFPVLVAKKFFSLENGFTLTKATLYLKMKKTWVSQYTKVSILPDFYRQWLLKNKSWSHFLEEIFRPADSKSLKLRSAAFEMQLMIIQWVDTSFSLGFRRIFRFSGLFYLFSRTKKRGICLPFTLWRRKYPLYI